MNTYETVLEELTKLRASLQGVPLACTKDARLVGSAIAYLAMLEDFLKDQKRKEEAWPKN